MYVCMYVPLRELTKKGVKYEWTPAQQQAFEQVKDAIMADCLMAYYDLHKKTTLTVDASPYGLGGPFCPMSRRMVQRGMLPMPVAPSQKWS